MATFENPPVVLTKDGRRRTVGLEIEFGGLTGRRAAELIQARFGGTLFETDPNAWCVEGTALGSFNVTLDVWFAHPKDKPSGLAGELQSTLAHLIGVAVGVVVPYEIITPPIPLDRLDEIAMASGTATVLQAAAAIIRRAGRGAQEGGPEGGPGGGNGAGFAGG